jgi:hypothetical protein
MSRFRVAPLPTFALLLAAWSNAPAQSVRSTHSGLLYFFEGYVFVGDEQVQQKFGRFPEIGEGRVLRTELGRAEVLLTPGVFLRVDENSAIRLLSDSVSDTRVELLRGSAILEVSHEAGDAPDTLIYKSWKMRLPANSIARIDSEPAQLRVLSGTAAVSVDGDPAVTVQRAEVLPLASVLVPESATTRTADNFNIWSMNRSSVVEEDNTIGAGITDDPDQFDTSGAALGGFTYFPQTGIPSLGITYPYGLSFWGLDQSWVNPWFNTGFNPYLVYPYGLAYRRLPGGTLLYQRPGAIFPGNSGIVRPFGSTIPRPSYAPLPRIPIAAPHVAAPHPIHR